MAADFWPVVRAERQALAEQLETRPEDELESPSLCAGWTIRDVLAHMAATAEVTPANFFPKLIGSGFSFSRMQEKDNARLRGATPSATLQTFEAHIDSKKRPPGPPQTMLGETIVHSEDIRRPLGLQHEYPMDSVQAVADFYKGSNLILGSKRRIAGISLRATDHDWKHGAGPEAEGPMLSLMLAMVGRKAALDDLAGPGVDVLRARP